MFSVLQFSSLQRPLSPLPISLPEPRHPSLLIIIKIAVILDIILITNLIISSMFILSTKRLQWSHVSIICLRLETNTFILFSTEFVSFQLDLQRFCFDSVPDFTEHFTGADNILGLVVHSLHHVGLHL